MRRADREITDRAQIEAFLRREQIMRIGFYDNGEIYIVPVNYGYTKIDGKDCFYFHGASAGRKYELSRQTPRVGFEIDGNYQLLPADTACGYSAAFQSVIGTGRLHLVEDCAEKRAGLACLMRQAAGEQAWEFPDSALRAAAVFRLDAEKLSCKAKE